LEDICNYHQSKVAKLWLPGTRPTGIDHEQPRPPLELGGRVEKGKKLTRLEKEKIWPRSPRPASGSMNSGRAETSRLNQIFLLDFEKKQEQKFYLL
jgi:hypothetical protein